MQIVTLDQRTAIGSCERRVLRYTIYQIFSQIISEIIVRLIFTSQIFWINF